MQKEKVLVLGSGGREHALAWKLRQSERVGVVYCAPGNIGISNDAILVPLEVDDFNGIGDFVRKNSIDLTVVGPDAPLVDGIVDHYHDSGLVEEGHLIFGPTRAAARLEGSKAWAKEFMKRHGIPTAGFDIFEDYDSAFQYVKSHGAPIVVKASGLAAGKGAIVCKTLDEAVSALDRIMVKREFGDAGKQVVVEEFMVGEEASILALTDGSAIRYLASSQDHKPVYDRDKGPNTGGMGAYAPAPVVTPSVMEKVKNLIVEPTINGMAAEGSPFQGCLYVGLMIDKKGNPRVVEFNDRFGDPEAQPVLFLLESDLYVLLKACAQGTLYQHDVVNKEGAACCVVMASGGYPDSYNKGFEIKGLDVAAGIPDVCVFHAGTKERDGKIVTNGGRVIGVNGVGKNIQEAINTAYSGVKEIHWDGEYHRKDIGHRALNR